MEYEEESTMRKDEAEERGRGAGVEDDSVKQYRTIHTACQQYRHEHALFW
jgi:hypothetical protein